MSKTNDPSKNKLNVESSKDKPLKDKPNTKPLKNKPNTKPLKDKPNAKLSKDKPLKDKPSKDKPNAKPLKNKPNAKLSKDKISKDKPNTKSDIRTYNRGNYYKSDIVDKLWDKMPTIENKDPKKYRLDDEKNVLYRPSFGKKTLMGFEKDHKISKHDGGSHDISNLRLLQTKANRVKGSNSVKKK